MLKRDPFQRTALAGRFTIESDMIDKPVFKGKVRVDDGWTHSLVDGTTPVDTYLTYGEALAVAKELAKSPAAKPSAPVVEVAPPQEPTPGEVEVH